MIFAHGFEPKLLKNLFKTMRRNRAPPTLQTHPASARRASRADCVAGVRWSRAGFPHVARPHRAELRSTRALCLRAQAARSDTLLCINREAAGF